ncbi:TlpA disulfide reductase family protein [Pedobacter sp. Du54]|uniref:TlpA disulfide reductase family protein n=1 Tax=Pedobacter anseongensis TaxID=3133439 RepID=UPI0030A23EB8
MSNFFGYAQQFNLSGQISGVNNVHIYIRYVDSEGKDQKDSCFTSKGSYLFKGKIKEPTRIYFAIFSGSFKWVDDSEPNVTHVYVEPGNNFANGDFKKFKETFVTSSETQRDALELGKRYSVLSLRLADLNERKKQLLQAYNDEKSKPTPNKNKVDSLNEELSKMKRSIMNVSDKFQDTTLQFITENPQSYISVEKLDNYKTRLKLDNLKFIYSQLTPQIRQSNNGNTIAKFILESENTIVGKAAKDFLGKNQNGTTVKLSDYRGKYILLDFWASWCIPCRESFPHLKELLKKYRSAGLEILTIAVDDKVDDWKNAIQKDRIATWHNILDSPSVKNGEVNNDAIHNQYNVHLLPTKLLIDPNGIIIARYNGADRTNDLDHKLIELFGH